MRCGRSVVIAAALLVTVPFVTTYPAAAQDFKEFKDWSAVCDNLRNCSAYGFNVDLAGDARAYLRVERGGAATAPVKITISVAMNKAASFRLAFDDPALPGLPAGAQSVSESEDSDYRRLVLTDKTQADTLIDSIRKAIAILVTPEPTDGKTIDTTPAKISMSGAAAALLWIDDQQKRIDTVTALIKRGARPASAVPPQPKASVIVAAKPTRQKPPVKHPAALIAKGRALCGEDDPKSELEDVHALGFGQVLYAFTCPGSSGAYNFHTEFLVGPAGDVKVLRQASFRWPVKIGDAASDGSGLTNPTFDAKTMTLSSFDKGRGIGDCGSEEQWVWDGKTFRLAQARMMSECHGVPMDDWPVVYRADVKR